MFKQCTTVLNSVLKCFILCYSVLILMLCTTATVRSSSANLAKSCKKLRKNAGSCKKLLEMQNVHKHLSNCTYLPGGWAAPEAWARPRRETVRGRGRPPRPGLRLHRQPPGPQHCLGGPGRRGQGLRGRTEAVAGLRLPGHVRQDGRCQRNFIRRKHETSQQWDFYN